MAPFNVIVAGSTGATGREVVSQLVSDPDCQRVTALTRRMIGEQEWPTTWPGINVGEAKRKLHIAVVDWEAMVVAAKNNSFSAEHLEIFREQDWAVWALGSTRRDAGSADAFRHIDLDYATAFVTALKKIASVKHYSVVSSQGASSSSMFLYMKTKGQSEDIATQAFPSVTVFRPGLLGRGDKARLVEKLASFVTSAMPTGRLATAMINDFKKRLAGAKFERQDVFGNREINYLAAHNA